RRAAVVAGGGKRGGLRVSVFSKVLGPCRRQREATASPENSRTAQECSGCPDCPVTIGRRWSGLPAARFPAPSSRNVSPISRLTPRRFPNPEEHSLAYIAAEFCADAWDKSRIPARSRGVL